MKTAIVMTSIDVPYVLALYRKLCPYTIFVIAGDEKAHHQSMLAFCEQIQPAYYLSPEVQRERGYKCSELLGWNTLARRNIATLEALSHGADVLHFIDYDNFPSPPNPYTLDYFCDSLLLQKFHGLEAHAAWFDPGQLLSPTVVQRGFPQRDYSTQWTVDPVTNVAIGVLSGLVLGDPDIDAVERMVMHPRPLIANELAQVGVVTDPRHTWTIFNSQNTVFLRELAPAMFMMPGVGRAVDIFASLITQRVMRERNLYVHLGRPFVFQQRTPHDPMTDLKAEMLNMERVPDLAHYLDGLVFNPGMSVADMTRGIYGGLQFEAKDWLPPEVFPAVNAWIEDCKAVLA